MSTRPGWPHAVVLVPALVAAYPAAFLWASNIGEITVGDGLAVMALYAAAGAVVHVLVWILGRPRLATSTIALVAAAITAVLFPVVLVAERLPLRFRFGVGLLAAAFFLLAAWLWRTGGHRPGWARAASIATLVLYAGLATSPVRIAIERQRLDSRLESVRGLTREIRVAGPAAQRPDIYLVLLDTYGSPEVLSRVYGIDNRAFLDSLRALGFGIHASRANYSATSGALAALLNVGYLDSLTPLLDGRTKMLWPFYELIHHDRLTEFLERRGYRSYLVPSVGWAGTSEHSRATVHLTTPEAGRLEGAWMRGRLLYYTWPHTLVGKLLPGRARWSTPESVRAAFDGTRQLLDLPGPKFVLTHSMAAHFPFSVDSLCDALPSEIPESEFDTPRAREAYIAGIRCTDRQVLGLVTDILAHAQRPPVILIQGDHGPRSLGIPWFGDAGASTAAQSVERLAVLGAYLLPGAPDLLPDSVTPVNVMRTVLSHYLGADLPPVPDRSFHATTDRPYRFVEVPPAVFSDSARRIFRADTSAMRSAKPLY